MSEIIATHHDSVEMLERRYASPADREDAEYRERQLAELARRFPSPAQLQESIASSRAAAGRHTAELRDLRNVQSELKNEKREKKAVLHEAEKEFYKVQNALNLVENNIARTDKFRADALRDITRTQRELDDVLAGKEKYFCPERKRLVGIREPGGPSVVTLQESQRAIREAVDRLWTRLMAHDKFHPYNIPPVRVPHGRRTPEDTLRMIEKQARTYAQHNGLDYATVLQQFKVAASQHLTLPSED